MADAFEVQLADAITTELQAATWPQPFSAERTWDPWVKGDDLTKLRCFVVPPAIPLSEREARGGTQPWKFGYQVVIDFQQEVPVGDDGRMDRATIDGLCRLVEAVHDSYRDNHQLAGLAQWYAIEATRPEVFVPQRLWEEHVFESYLELVIRGWR